jgi:hypothetical protein
VLPNVKAYPWRYHLSTCIENNNYLTQSATTTTDTPTEVHRSMFSDVECRHYVLYPSQQRLQFIETDVHLFETFVWNSLRFLGTFCHVDQGLGARAGFWGKHIVIIIIQLMLCNRKTMEAKRVRIISSRTIALWGVNRFAKADVWCSNRTSSRAIIFRYIIKSHPGSPRRGSSTFPERCSRTQVYVNRIAFRSRSHIGTQ